MSIVIVLPGILAATEERKVGMVENHDFVFGGLGSLCVWYGKKSCLLFTDKISGMVSKRNIISRQVRVLSLCCVRSSDRQLKISSFGGGFSNLNHRGWFFSTEVLSGSRWTTSFIWYIIIRQGLGYDPFQDWVIISFIWTIMF